MLSLLVALCSSASPVLLQDLVPGAAVDNETYLEVDTGADPNVLVVQNNHWGAELYTILDTQHDHERAPPRHRTSTMRHGRPATSPFRPDPDYTRVVPRRTT